jgi:hypothetical protein
VDPPRSVVDPDLEIGCESCSVERVKNWAENFKKKMTENDRCNKWDFMALFTGLLLFVKLTDSHRKPMF